MVCSSIGWFILANLIIERVEIVSKTLNQAN